MAFVDGVVLVVAIVAISSIAERHHAREGVSIDLMFMYGRWKARKGEA